MRKWRILGLYNPLAYIHPLRLWFTTVYRPINPSMRILADNLIYNIDNFYPIHRLSDFSLWRKSIGQWFFHWLTLICPQVEDFVVVAPWIHRLVGELVATRRISPLVESLVATPHVVSHFHRYHLVVDFWCGHWRQCGTQTWLGEVHTRKPWRDTWSHFKRGVMLLMKSFLELFYCFNCYFMYY